MSLEVAVVQLRADEDAAANADQARSAVLAAGPADLVVLPEYSSGWAPRLHQDLAQEDDGVFARAQREAAQRSGRTVIAGTMRRDGLAVDNLTVAIDGDGGSVGEYRKVHLFDAYGITESETLRAGAPGAEHALTFDCGDLRVGVATCYDLRFPETFRVLADAGANVFAVGAAWASGPGKADILLTLARARAIENTSYLLLSSQCGPGRSGTSAIIDPRGQVLAQAGPDETVTLHARLEESLVAQVRREVPSLAHRRYRVLPS